MLATTGAGCVIVGPELADAARSIAEDAKAGTLEPGEITADTISARLYTSEYPDPDLLIRTGGESRISNFMLWQTAYTELYFTDVHWPDFDADALKKAIHSYGQRVRRFGRTDEQVKDQLISQPQT